MSWFFRKMGVFSVSHSSSLSSGSFKKNLFFFFLDWRIFSSAIASTPHFCRGQLFIEDTVLPPRHRQPCLPPSPSWFGAIGSPCWLVGDSITECLCGPDSDAILLHPLCVAHSLRAVSSPQSHQRLCRISGEITSSLVSHSVPRWTSGVLFASALPSTHTCSFLAAQKSLALLTQLPADAPCQKGSDTSSAANGPNSLQLFPVSF